MQVHEITKSRSMRCGYGGGVRRQQLVRSPVAQGEVRAAGHASPPPMTAGQHRAAGAKSSASINTAGSARPAGGIAPSAPPARQQPLGAASGWQCQWQRLPTVCQLRGRRGRLPLKMLAGSQPMAPRAMHMAMPLTARCADTCPPSCRLAGSPWRLGPCTWQCH